MTTPTPLPRPLPSHIYGPAGICSLLDRAWNLFKRNGKASFLLLMVPLIISTLASLLSTIPSSLPTMTEFSVETMLISLGVMLVAVVVGGVAWFVTFVMCCTLTRLYYSALVGETPLTIRQALSAFKHIWPVMILVFMGFLCFWFTFVFIDIFVFLLGMAATLSAMAMLTTSSSYMVQGGAVIVAVFAGALTFLVLFVLVAFQSLLFSLSMIAFAITDETYYPVPGWTLDFDAWMGYLFGNMAKITMMALGMMGIIFSNVMRAMRFGALLLLLYMILVCMFHIPVFIWMAVEFERLSLFSESIPGLLPMHVSIVFQLWSGLVAAVVWSYMLAALTLFLYDCRVRSEGLDIQLMFERMQDRKREVLKRV
jgi:hypothetical protein